MLNNEFRLIGTIVSEFEKGGTENFPKYKVSIEVEKKTKGKAATFSLTVYEKNFAVDVTKSLLGKRVIASGYVDSYKDYTSLVLQDVIVIGDTEEIDKAINSNETNLSDDEDFPF